MGFFAGCAFIKFNSRKEALAAINSINGTVSMPVSSYHHISNDSIDIPHLQYNMSDREYMYFDTVWGLLPWALKVFINT